MTSLFNRVVLDLIIGFLFLALGSLILTCLHIDIISMISSSELGAYRTVIIVISGYLAGTAIDKSAYLVLDRSLFAKEFEERRSSFEIPGWCLSLIEEALPPGSSLPGSGPSRIDESSADWISAAFLAVAPVEAQIRRRDLIANFQFISNLFAVTTVAAVVIPVYALADRHRPALSLAAFVATVLLAVAFRSFSIAALRRVHTFENLAIFGILLARRPPFAGAGEEPGNTPTSSTHTCQAVRQGTVRRRGGPGRVAGSRRR